MNYIRSIRPGVLHYTCGGYSRNDIINCKNILAHDLKENSLTVDDLQDSILLLDFLSEGHDPAVINLLIDYLADLIGIDRIRVLFNAIVDTSSLSYRARYFATHFTTWDGRFVNDGDQSAIKLENKFLCLARRPTEERAKFVSQVLESVPTVRASFGSGFPGDSLRFQKYFTNHTLPILMDGDARNYVHNLASDAFRTCLFNIIIETSNQLDSNNWTSIFLTEKTFKCFDLYQIPIWFTVPGTVAEVRKLGFDLFDDIVNHSYDDIDNQEDRRNSICAQIKELNNKFLLEDCQQLRNSLYQRLLDNYKLLDKFTQEYNQIADQLIKELIA
jgi:hypothetical protein